MHLPRFPTPIREILPEHLPQARPWARCSGNVTSSSSSSRQNVGQPLLNGSAAGSLGMAEMWRQVENGWEAIGGGKGWAANSGEDAGSSLLWRGESIPPLRDGTSCWGAVGLAAGRVGRAGPRTHAGKGGGAWAWRAAKAGLGGTGGSSRTPGRWCGGGSGSGGAGPGQRSGLRGRGTGSGLSLQLLPALPSPRTPRGGDWPPRWPWGMVGLGRSPSWAPPRPWATWVCATVISRDRWRPRRQTGPGPGIPGYRSPG